MKSVEGKGWAHPSSGAEENVQIPAVEILKASLLLKGAKGMGYIMSLLRGTDREDWIKDEHRHLSSYRALSAYARDVLMRTFHFLVDEGLMAPLNNNHTAFQISEEGKAFLSNPSGVWLQRAYLHLNKGETYFYARLRTLRKSLAEKYKMKEFDVFPEYTLDRFVMKLPTDTETMMRVPGMNLFRLELYGHELLDFLLDLPKTLREVQQRRIDYWNSMPDHRFVRTKVLEDRNIKTIAEMIGYDLGRIERILQDLHTDSEIDLRAWIEGQVGSKLLYKGVDYFRKAGDQTLNTAQKALGLDMASLVLSRLYVHISTHKPYAEGMAYRQAS
jgi:HRDC domain/RQC domain